MAIDVCLLWLLCCLVTVPQVSSNSKVSDAQETLTVKPSEPIELQCRDGGNVITDCFWHVGETYYLGNTRNGKTVSLEDNESACVITKDHANDDDNLEWQCTVNGKHKTFKVVVIKTPKDPIITVNGGGGTKIIIEQNKKPNITCQVDDGRPEAQISMYLTKSGYSPQPLNITTWAYKHDNTDSHRSGASWNVPKHEDLIKYNDWYLQCKAQHQGYASGEKEANGLLDVLYQPKFEIVRKQYSGEIGKMLTVFFNFTANPKPKSKQIQLEVTRPNGAGVTIEAPSSEKFGNGTYTLQYTKDLKENNQLRATLSINIFQPEHTKYKHKLIVTNSQGEETHEFTLTSEPYTPVAQPWLSKFEHVLGVSIAGGVLLLLVFVLVMSAVCFMRRRKVRNRQEEVVARRHSKSRKDYPTYSRYDSVPTPDEEAGFTDALGDTHRNMMASKIMHNGKNFFQPKPNSRDRDDGMEDREYRQSLETRKETGDPENEIEMDQPRRSVTIHISPSEKDRKNKRTAMDVFTECLFS